MVSPIMSVFTAAGIACDQDAADNERPVVWLDLECAIGPDQIGQFRLMAFGVENELKQPYVRLYVSPLFTPSEEQFAVTTWATLARLNFDLVGSKLVLDPDGDIGLSLDVPIEQFQPTQLTTLLDHLSIDIGTVYYALSSAVDNDDSAAKLSQQAQNFIENQEGLDLDLSVVGLERFEDNVDEGYRQFLQHEGLLEPVARAFGAYIGEILVHQGSGAWQFAEEYQDSRVRIGGQIYQPFLIGRSFLTNPNAVRPSIIVRRTIKR